MFYLPSRKVLLRDAAEHRHVLLTAQDVAAARICLSLDQINRLEILSQLHFSRSFRLLVDECLAMESENEARQVPPSDGS